MDDFIVLKYSERTPTLAMCRKCKVKFFAIHASIHDPIGAQQYLWDKFNAHNCKVEEFPSKHRRFEPRKAV